MKIAKRNQQRRSKRNKVGCFRISSLRKRRKMKRSMMKIAKKMKNMIRKRRIKKTNTVLKR